MSRLKINTQFHPCPPYVAWSPCSRCLRGKILGAHFMEQNGGPFRRLWLAIPTKIPERTQAERVQNASIKSLESVFGAKRHLANALHGNELEPLAAQVALTKCEKTSSAGGFCHFVPTGAQTKRTRNAQQFLPSPPPSSRITYNQIRVR
jgi:hypothetical protein